MTAWWMAQLLIIGLLLALAAGGANIALTALRLPTRWVWVAALGSTLVLGGMAAERFLTATTRASVTAPTVSATNVAPSVAVISLPERIAQTWHAGTATINTLLHDGWSAGQRAMPARTNQWLLLAWVLSSASILLFVIAAHWRYRRQRAHWPRRTLGTTPVRVADTIGPAVIGVTNAEIVVPQWLVQRNANEIELVLAHEREHLQQHDPILLAFAQLAVIVLPWHPAVWWMAARLKLAVELDCDSRVLRRGISTRDYGSLLIDLADHRTGFGNAVPAFSCSPSHLERRLIAMTPRPLRYPMLRALTTGAIASLAVLAACESNLPTSQDVEQMTAATAVQATARVSSMDTSRVSYFIDGKPATKAEADKLSAERVATVNVLQRGMERGGEVRITTRDSDASNAGASILEERVVPPELASARISFVRTDSTAPRRATNGAAIEERRINQKAFDGLTIIDGVIAENSAVNALSPNDIVSVNVLKGAAAQAQYSDPRAANGVIQITTKKAKM